MDTSPRQFSPFVIGSLAALFVFTAIVGGYALLRDTSVPSDGDAEPPAPTDGAAAAATVTASLGERVSGGGVFVTPVELIEDSRCPIDAVCIQAGTVRVRTTLESGLGTAEQVFGLSLPITTETQEVTLVAVSPSPLASAPAQSGAYRFTFEVKSRTTPTPSIAGLPESSIVPNAPTDFAKAGTFVMEPPESGTGTAYLVYEALGAPALRKELRFDVESTCAAENGALPCMAMSVTLDMPYGGKRVSVEGLMQKNDVVLVRLLRALPEGATGEELRTGALILSWPSAVRLIETCRVASVSQTHALDIGLELRDGRRVRTVEPVIDEVFRAVERAVPACGTIPLATE